MENLPEIAEQFAMNMGFFIAITIIVWLILTPIIVLTIKIIRKLERKDKNK